MPRMNEKCHDPPSIRCRRPCPETIQKSILFTKWSNLSQTSISLTTSFWQPLQCFHIKKIGIIVLREQYWVVLGKSTRKRFDYSNECSIKKWHFWPWLILRNLSL